MSLRSLGPVMTVACLAAPASAWAAPPVEVEVLVGDDASEDLVEKRTSTKGESGPVTTQTQVVNIHINGERVSPTPRETAKADPERASPEPASVPESMSRPDMPTPIQKPPPVPSDERPIALARGELGPEKPKSWWKSPYPEAGSVVLTLQGGSYKGLGLEVYANDVVGLHVDVGFDDLDYDDRDASPRSNVEAGGFALPAIENRDISGGLTYLVDAGPRFHVIPESRFDLHLGFGLSLFGYHIERFEGASLDGGSVLGRMSAGLRWHWNRLSIGVDASWLPLEIARFRIVERLGEDRLDGIDLSNADRFRGDRFAVAWKLGFRF